MVKVRLIVAITTALAVVASMSGASAEDEFRAYITCNGETPSGNAHVVLDDRISGLSPNAPTGGPESACGTTDTFLSGTSNQNPIYDFPVEGLVDGPIDTVTVRLWGIDTSGSRQLREWTVDLHLVIDGVEVLPRTDGTATRAHAPVVGARQDPARLYEVTITGVSFPPGEHEIQLTVYSKFIDGSGVVTWVYNTAQWDSGLIFNDATPAATKIPAGA